jgi:glycosyltransferase involved in cell wall biosynthesis
MNKNPQVSILIPVHNCEETLERSLNSLMNQTFHDFEVIIVLNRCSDKSKDISLSYRKEFPLTILNCDTPGIVPTLNTGIHKCSADLIARQDGDDFWYPNKLELQIDFLKNNPSIDILGTQIKLVQRAKNDYIPVIENIYHPLDNDSIKLKLLNGSNSIAHPSVIFKKSILLKSGGYEDTYKFAEDYYLWLKCLRWYNFSNLKEILVDYTVSKNTDYDPRMPQLACYNTIQVLKQQGILK